MARKESEKGLVSPVPAGFGRERRRCGPFGGNSPFCGNFGKEGGVFPCVLACGDFFAGRFAMGFLVFAGRFRRKDVSPAGGGAFALVFPSASDAFPEIFPRCGLWGPLGCRIRRNPRRGFRGGIPDARTAGGFAVGDFSARSFLDFSGAYVRRAFGRASHRFLRTKEAALFETFRGRGNGRARKTSLRVGNRAPLISGMEFPG